MKKPVLMAAFAAALSGPALAQITDHSICPDWTGTDLNGNVHNLYSLLDSGYTVFIDVSATWCPPCWTFHNTGALENLYLQHGPGTVDNKVRVFMIEGDGATTMADLQGNTSATMGNWIEGTPYPIIDNAGIADLLQISYFPTLYKVCPNRVITEEKNGNNWPTAASMWASVGSCQQAMSGTDATLLSPLSNPQGCAGSSVGVSARLQNVGTQTLTNATIEARVGSTVLGSTNWTGSLDTYEVANVDVATFTPTGNTNVTLQITTADGNAGNNSTVQPVKASTVTAYTQVTFKLKTDNYGTETRWKLFNGNGTMVYQGGPYANGNQPENVYEWSLSNQECYRLEVHDSYGDGFCCSYGNGYYKLISNGQTVIQGGSFGDVDIKHFTTDVSIGMGENTLDRSLAIFPNPTTGLVNVEYNLDQATLINVVVTDLVGKVVMSTDLRNTGGEQRQTLDLGELSNGLYLLKLDAGKYQATRTMTINK